jgi:hypothetical protein
MALVFDKIILFGDSITQLAYNQEFGFCYGPAMQDGKPLSSKPFKSENSSSSKFPAYSRKLDVIQRGFGGYTSKHAAIIIDRLIEQESAGSSKIKLLVYGPKRIRQADTVRQSDFV